MSPVSSVAFIDSSGALGELLDRVGRGETITLVTGGEPVAVLSPSGPTDEADRRSAIEALRAFGQGRTLGGDTLRQLVEEGRRGRID